jgi:hypothetical protein
MYTVSKSRAARRDAEGVRCRRGRRVLDSSGSSAVPRSWDERVERHRPEAEVVAEPGS